MRVLIAVGGAEGEKFFRLAATLVPLAGAERVLLSHVIDIGPRSSVDGGRERFLSRRPLSEARAADLTRAEEDRARAALQYARQVLMLEGVRDETLTEVVLRGRPNEALRELAEREGIDLIVVGGWGGRPGPHSVGKTARFLIDHTPSAALLIRG